MKYSLLTESARIDLASLTKDEAVLALLARDENWEVVDEVANNPNTSMKTLRDLINKGNSHKLKILTTPATKVTRHYLIADSAEENLNKKLKIELENEIHIS